MLKILIITQGLSRIVTPLVTSQHNVVAVLESAPRGARPGWPWRLLGRLRSKVAKAFFAVDNLQDYCRAEGIAYRMLYSSQDPGLPEWVNRFAPDLIVVHSMSQLLSKSIYSLPRLGAINLHPSLLPKYRGPNPDFWHYYDVDLTPGVTVHYIDEGEDTGDILAQGFINVPLGIKSPDRSQRLISEVGVRLLLQTLDALNAGTATRQPQPVHVSNRRARNLRAEEHATIIEWQQWPVERVWNVLRGTEQWLNAIAQPGGVYTGQRWSVGDYHVASTGQFQPGEVYRHEGHFRVACKEGYISLTRTFHLKFLLIHIVTRLLKQVAR
ncbi:MULTISPECIES: methionyl-tRNA formyltransferase [Pseudomonas]|uniref:Methionyl-tRNA formyltransferase n=1 Tax=Pseudomonas mosselii TaxID=78327 RepID=A0A5R8Z7Q6_9PSED|nr:formyltransferase family protein [Pseudomonas mosselii]TLP61157.1 methionyl-tRNA formyltransferase [Pseudomonas mosselii]